MAIESFDARGDGYGRGEGAGAVLIKPLAAAIEAGDTILATVVGTGTIRMAAHLESQCLTVKRNRR